MAWLELYMQTTGSNLNSGTDANDAAAYTSTGGNFDGTSVFTPTDGSTPASNISVGDWVSLYNTGDTIVRYMAQVTAVGAGVNGTVTVSTTQKFGTAPTSNSGSRNLKKGGALASMDIGQTNGAFNGGIAPTPARMNIKAGTYAHSNYRNFFSGTTTNPCWFRGYKTTPGDLDGFPASVLTPGTDMPHLTWSFGSCQFGGGNNVYCRVSSISILSSSVSAVNIVGNGQYIEFLRCRLESTVASSSARAFASSNNTGGAFALLGCYLKATSSADTIVLVGSNTSVVIIGCYLEGGGNGVTATNTTPILNNLFAHIGDNGVVISGAGGRPIVMGNTFYDVGSDGIEFSGVVVTTPAAQIVNNIFEQIGGYSFNNSSGTVYATPGFLANSHYGVTSGVFSSNFGDDGELYQQLESASHFNNAAGGDFSLKSTSVAKAAGFPALLEGNSNHTFLDIGALQRQEAGGVVAPAARSILMGGLCRV
jgi:hypothetical protein